MMDHRKRCYVCGLKDPKRCEGMICDDCEDRVRRAGRLTEAEQEAYREETRIRAAVMDTIAFPPRPIQALISRAKTKIGVRVRT